jgi:hypothetical protein
VNRRRRAYRPDELPERIKEAGRPLPEGDARPRRRRPWTGSKGEHLRRAMAVFLLRGLLAMAKAQWFPQTLGPSLPR